MKYLLFITLFLFILSIGSTNRTISTLFHRNKTEIDAKAKCNHFFVEPSKTFYSPSYHPSNHTTVNETCEWHIAGPPGVKISLKILDMDIEKTFKCTTDYIEIRDGTWNNSQVLERVCGNGLLDPIISTGNGMYIIYVNNNTTKHRGFAAKYEMIGKIINQHHEHDKNTIGKMTAVLNLKMGSVFAVLAVMFKLFKLAAL